MKSKDQSKSKKQSNKKKNLKGHRQRIHFKTPLTKVIPSTATEESSHDDSLMDILMHQGYSPEQGDLLCVESRSTDSTDRYALTKETVRDEAECEEVDPSNDDDASRASSFYTGTNDEEEHEIVFLQAEDMRMWPEPPLASPTHADDSNRYEMIPTTNIFFSQPEDPPAMNNQCIDPPGTFLDKYSLLDETVCCESSVKKIQVENDKRGEDISVISMDPAIRTSRRMRKRRKCTTSSSESTSTSTNVSNTGSSSRSSKRSDRSAIASSFCDSSKDELVGENSDERGISQQGGSLESESSDTKWYINEKSSAVLSIGKESSSSDGTPLSSNVTIVDILDDLEEKDELSNDGPDITRQSSSRSTASKEVISCSSSSSGQTTHSNDEERVSSCPLPKHASFEVEEDVAVLRKISSPRRSISSNNNKEALIEIPTSTNAKDQQYQFSMPFSFSAFLSGSSRSNEKLSSNDNISENEAYRQQEKIRENESSKRIVDTLRSMDQQAERVFRSSNTESLPSNQGTSSFGSSTFSANTSDKKPQSTSKEVSIQTENVDERPKGKNKYFSKAKKRRSFFKSVFRRKRQKPTFFEGVVEDFSFFSPTAEPTGDPVLPSTGDSELGIFSGTSFQHRRGRAYAYEEVQSDDLLFGMSNLIPTSLISFLNGPEEHDPTFDWSDDSRGFLSPMSATTSACYSTSCVSSTLGKKSIRSQITTRGGNSVGKSIRSQSTNGGSVPSKQINFTELSSPSAIGDNDTSSTKSPKKQSKKKRRILKLFQRSNKDCNHVAEQEDEEDLVEDQREETPTPRSMLIFPLVVPSMTLQQIQDMAEMEVLEKVEEGVELIAGLTQLGQKAIVISNTKRHPQRFYEC